MAAQKLERQVEQLGRTTCWQEREGFGAGGEAQKLGTSRMSKEKPKDHRKVKKKNKASLKPRENLDSE